MANFRTHYDNLQVARTASVEVIGAAYRSLCRTYHPDLNPSDAEAQRRMQIINASYDVLSDPERRRKHDEWISQMEAAHNSLGSRKSFASDGSNQTHRSPERPRNPYSARGNRSYASEEKITPNAGSWRTAWQAPLLNPTAKFAKLVIAVLAGPVLIWIALVVFDSAPRKSNLPPYQDDAKSATNSVDGLTSSSDYTEKASPIVIKGRGRSSRSEQAPNGVKWPSRAGYVPDYPLLRTGGKSAVTVDNSGNDSPVFVKLVSIVASATQPVRHIYIPAGSSFKMKGLMPGTYDVRYMNLEDGSLARSESFELRETRTTEGFEFSDVTMTLYRVRNGNMQTYPLDPNEF